MQKPPYSRSKRKRDYSFPGCILARFLALSIATLLVLKKEGSESCEQGFQEAAEARGEGWVGGLARGRMRAAQGAL